MEGILSLGFFSMANKVTNVLGKSFPYIVTGCLIAAIWIYFLFLVPRKARHYESLSAYLSDIFHFRVMLVGAIAKVLYLASAILVLLIGLVAMFVYNFFTGLIGLIILQMLLRLIFEVVMVLFSIQENFAAIKGGTQNHSIINHNEGDQ